MPPRRIDWIKTQIGDLLELHCQGEEFFWDTTLLSTQQGMTLALVLWLRGPVIGTVFTSVAPVPGFPLTTPEQVEEFVPSLVRSLLEERSRQLSQMQQEAAHAGNGQPPPDLTNLILPGRG
jgi:hypothetical protein